MNHVKFVSSYYSNVDTSITLTKNNLILEDERTIELFDLNKLTLNVLKSIKTLSIKSNPINIDNLLIEYNLVIEYDNNSRTLYIRCNINY